MGVLTPVLAAAAALAVPFVPQDKDTCGAAALAMVLHYWQHPVAHDEIAAALVEPNLEGIRGSRLADFVRARGLFAITYKGDLDQLRDQLSKGRPLIVALRQKHDRFHDVVVVGTDPSRRLIVINDPAVGPGRTISEKSFEEGWAGAGYWTLLVLPEQKPE